MRETSGFERCLYKYVYEKYRILLYLEYLKIKLQILYNDTINLKKIHKKKGNLSRCINIINKEKKIKKQRKMYII